MDKEKREELRTKRLNFQKSIHRKKLEERIFHQISLLENLKESYVVYYEFENLNWINTNLKVRKRDGYSGIHGDFQVDVDDTQVKEVITMEQKEIGSSKFKSIFSSFISDECKLIICYQGGDPEIEISKKAFLKSPGIFLTKPETWILASDKKWIVEHIWEQDIIRFIQLDEFEPTLIKKILLK